MTLLQLAGGQIWPNLLPILAFRPDRVVFLTSGDPKQEFAAKIHAMQDALAVAGTEFHLDLAAARGTHPTMSSCLEAIEPLKGIDLINLTGGTKPMTLAAHRFASDHSIPSFYLDTRRTENPFEDMGTGPLGTAFPGLISLAAEIDVRLALAAQGFPLPANLATPSDSELAFAREASEIRASAEDDREISSSMRQFREAFHENRGAGRFLAKGKLRSALVMPVAAPPGSAWHRYLAAAARHGIIEPLDSGHEFLLAAGDPTTMPSEELRSRAQRHFKLLEGIWFELAVFTRLQSKSSFTDVQWSVQADPDATPHPDAWGETDLVAFNANTLGLHFVSCKTTGPHGPALDHIQALRGRATKDGGPFANAELWIFRPRTSDQRATLEALCRQHAVTLRVFTDPS